MVWVKSNPLHLLGYTRVFLYIYLYGKTLATLTPFFIILIILNIVQNLSLHLSMPFILCLHPPYPTSPPTPNLATPTPSPTPDWTPRPNPPPPQKKNFFFEFSQKLHFSDHIHPDPQPDATSPPKKKIIFKKVSLLRSHPL